jgi:hypothetical protein
VTRPLSAADMTDVQTRVGADGIIEVLFARGTLFHLYIGRWTGNKKLRERDLLMEGEVDKTAMHIGHKKLLPPEAHARIQRLDSRARQFLDARSMPFPLGNSRYVPYSKLSEVIRGLNDLKPQWDEAIDFLIVNYEQFKAEQLNCLAQQSHVFAETELGKVAPEKRVARRKELKAWEEDQDRINRSLYPTAEVLRSKFMFEWRMFKVSPLEGIEQMTGLDADAVAAEYQRIVDTSQQFVREAAAMLHKELGEAAANAASLLKENGRLSARSLRPLFDTFESFQGLSFGQSDAMATIEQIRSRYLARVGTGDTNWELTTDLVNDAKGEFETLLSSISKYAVSDVAEAAGLRSLRSGDFGRVIDL